ncbi:MAG: TetR/AcrR family transcriptional regulator [Pseudomonadota bacterium]
MKTQRSNSRNEALLQAAAMLFASRGFLATSMRDIAKAVDMLPGSIYYHFPSKDDLLLAIYQAGVEQISATFTEAVTPLDDPWQRLSAGMAALVRAVTEESSGTRVIFKVMPDDVPRYRDELIAFRDEFEALFRDLIEQLPLQPNVDKHLVRLMMLGAGNHAQLWFSREGPYTPDEIGEQFCHYLQHATARAEP